MLAYDKRLNELVQCVRITDRELLTPNCYRFAHGKDQVILKSSEETITAMPTSSRRYEEVITKEIAKESDTDFGYVHSMIMKYELEVEMEVDDSMGTTASFLVGTKLDLLKRDNIIQGWALVEDQCPQGTGTCGT
ncbi:hypothetical protein BDZ45DRAFT_697811 [Acephala macrosclerotiorum]|nr:hypothetical protein BDZ45DRAFT_697811 [Acephala macrosclerotiorum]